MKFYLYLVFKWYDAEDGSKKFSYERALMAMSCLIYVHIYTVLAICHLTWLILIPVHDSMAARFIALLYMLPIYLILAAFYRKKSLQSLKYDARKIMAGRIYLITDVVMVVLIFFGFNLFEGGFHW